MKANIKSGFVLLTVLLLASSLAAADYTFKVIVHADNSTTALNLKTLSNMFLKKLTKWADGQKVEAVDLVDTSAVRQDFSQAVHGRKVASIKSYWQKQIFSGREVPPAEKRGEDEILEYVQNTPGAIGYISISKSTGRYKVKEINVED